jgi:hypothetical protein
MKVRTGPIVALATAAFVILAPSAATAHPAAHPAASPTTHTVTGLLSSISCATPTVCFAIDHANKATRWGVTRLEHNGASTHTTLASKAFIFNSLSCPSKSGCEVLATRISTNSAVLIPVSSSGKIGKPRKTGAPAGTFIAAMSCYPTRSHCTLVGAFGGTLSVVTIDGSKSTTHHRKIGSEASINAINCSTSTSCEAVGLIQANTNKGFEVPIHRGIASKPVVVQHATGSGLVSVACVNAHICYAAGDSFSSGDFIDTLTNGKVTHSSAPTAGTEISQIACASVHSCDAVGEYFPPSASAQGFFFAVHNGTQGAVQPTSLTVVYNSVAEIKGGIETVGADAGPHGLWHSIVTAT